VVVEKLLPIVPNRWVDHYKVMWPRWILMHMSNEPQTLVQWTKAAQVQSW
jgi:hypothetical protein